MVEIKESMVPMVMPHPGRFDGSVFEALDRMEQGQSRIFTDDNGGLPDGDKVYIAPRDEFAPEVVQAMLDTDMLIEVIGDIVEYDGDIDTEQALDEKYPAGWAGFSSRDEAYCWTPQA